MLEKNSRPGTELFGSEHRRVSFSSLHPFSLRILEHYTTVKICGAEKCKPLMVSHFCNFNFPAATSKKLKQKKRSEINFHNILFNPIYPKHCYFNV